MAVADVSDETLARLGIATRSDLRRAGWSDRAITRAVTTGELQRPARGVYVRPWRGHAEPSVEGVGPEEVRWRWDAVVAVVTAGLDAVVGGSSAAHLWGLDGYTDPVRPIEIVLPAGRGIRRDTEPTAATQRPAPTSRRTGAAPSMTVRRRSRREAPDRIDGIPVSGIGDTLCALGGSGAGLASRRRADRWGHPTIDDAVELAVEAALRHGMIDVAALSGLAAEAPNRHGSAVLRRVLARRPPGEPPTESELETRMVQLLRSAGLPAPHRQVELFDIAGRIGRFDLVIGRVVIELDGRRTHDNDPAFHRDRRRWVRLQAAGYLPLVFTYVQVLTEPAAVAAAVAQTLARAGELGTT